MSKTPLAQRLRSARNAIHPQVTQRAVGERFDLTPGAINLWEAGKTEPGASQLVELAKWYGVSVDWLLGLDNTSAKLQGRATAERPEVFVVPIVDEASLINWRWMGATEHLQTEAMYPTGTAAAFKVSSDSMKEIVPSGSFAVVCKSSECLPGDIVLASIARSPAPVVRRYILEAGKEYLVADDQRYPSYVLEEGGKIIGRVTEVVTRKVLPVRIP